MKFEIKSRGRMNAKVPYLHHHNKNHVHVGDRIAITRPCETYGDYNVGDYATVTEVDTDGVIVKWEKGSLPPDRRLNYVMHNEYRIWLEPRLHISEKLAIVLLVVVVAAAVTARYFGLYDIQ